MQQFDLSIIGQGYAGLSAARHARHRGLRVANVECHMMGGLIINVNELDPRPEGAEPSGAELASNLAMQNMDDGVSSLSETVTGLEAASDGGWIIQCGEATHSARQVIVASGARLRKLGIPGETQFFGQGVSECADCDGPLFKGMDTVIVGGGDAAFQEALALAHYARSITMILRGQAARARASLRTAVAAQPKIRQLLNAQLIAIEGSEGHGVESVRLRSGAGAESTLATSGVFVFIGLAPNSQFLPEALRRDAHGAIITAANLQTSLPGVWAIGAVRSGFGGLLSDAGAEAAQVIAALQ